MQITSFQTSLPLKLQIHQATGFFACFIIMLGIYYGNGWDSKSLPFMSTRLLQANGTAYPVATIFPGGVLDEGALEVYGVPKLTGSFAFSMFMANAAVGVTLFRLKIKAKTRPDWCFGCTHHPLLGKRYLADLQECESR